MERSSRNPFVTSSEAFRIAYFDFERTRCDLLEGEIMTSHFEEEMDATFQISVVSVFLVEESGPVGIFKDSPSDLSPRTFSPPSKKRLKQKH